MLPVVRTVIDDWYDPVSWGLTRTGFGWPAEADSVLMIFGAQFRNAAGVPARNDAVSNVIEIVNTGPAPAPNWTVT